MHTLEELMELLCCCEGYDQCDFHRILSARLISREKLREVTGLDFMYQTI